MNNSPAPATKRSGQKLTLTAVLLAVVGVAVWGRVSARKTPGDVDPGAVLRQQDFVPDGWIALHFEGKGKTLEQAVDRVLKAPNSTPLQLREAYLNKAILARLDGRPNDAIDHYRKAAELVDKAKQPLLWTDIESQAAYRLYYEKRYQEARDSFREILRIREANLKANDLDVFDALCMLTNCISHISLGKEDIPLYRQFLDLKEASVGRNHPDFVFALDDVAKDFNQFGHHTEAATCLRKSLNIIEANFGSNHKDIPIHLEKLIQTLKQANQPVAAEPHVRRLLQIKAQELGKEHPGIVGYLIALGEIMQTNLHPTHAAPLFQRAYDILLYHSLGAEGYQPNDLEKLAGIFKAANRFEEAEALCRKGLDDPINIWEYDLTVKTSALHILSEILEKTNRLPEAEIYLRKAVRITLKMAKKDPTESVSSQATVADYLRVTRALQTSDEETHVRLDQDREVVMMDEEKFKKIWKQALTKNPKDAVNEQPTSPK